MKSVTTPGKRVGIWIRVSTEDQAQGESPEVHRIRAERYAEFQGWTVVEVYDLAGVSGKSVWEHPECQRMLRDAKRGHIQGLIFSKLARLARNTKELLDFAQYFEKHKATLVSIEEKIDTSTPAGLLFYTMLGAIAQWEREEITSRLRSSIGVRAKLGKPLNGLAPYGYKWTDKNLVLVPAEAAVRREAFELFLTHRRKGVVARLLHEKGYRSRGGKEFRDVHIDRMLRCSSAKGLYRTNLYRVTKSDGWKKEAKPESEWGTAECPAIVSAEMFDRVAAILEEQTKPKRIPGKKPVHIFAGLLKCGCGGKMYVYTRSPNYTCAKCKNKISAAVLEEIFTGSIAENLADTAQIAAHLDRSKSKIAEHHERAVVIRTQCEGVRAEMKKLYDLYIAGGLSVEQFKELNTPLYDRLGQLTGELAKLEGEDTALAVGGLSIEAIAHEARNLAALWPTLDVDGKQRLAATICTEIIVPDKDPDAPIEIVFAHSAPPKVEAPIRVGADSEAGASEENFSEVSNRLNSQRYLRVARNELPWVPATSIPTLIGLYPRLIFTLSLLLSFLLTLPLHAADPDPTKGIVFCAYNVRNYVGDDQVAPADQRAKPKTEKEIEALISVILEVKPDILGVSEMGSQKMFDDFKARLAKAGLDYQHSEYLQAGDPDRHVALVSRFPIVARNSVKRVVFTLNGEEQEMKRGILDVTVQVTPDYKLRCVGVHLKSKLPTPAGEALIRRHEAAKLREHLDTVLKANPAENLICYGDCNDTKNEPMFAEITGVKGSPTYMADLWAKDMHGDRWTHYWRFADQYSRIDYLFVSPGLWPEARRNTATVNRSPNWLDASDHRAVHVTILPVETK